MRRSDLNHLSTAILSLILAKATITVEDETYTWPLREYVFLVNIHKPILAKIS